MVNTPMDLENDPRIERHNPDAPVTFNLQKCQRWIASAPNFRRQPLGEFVVEILGQLKCAVDELSTVQQRIDHASTQTTRYQKEAETANAEVRAMQRLLNDEREKAQKLDGERTALTAEVAALKLEIEKLKTAPAPETAPPKRARRAKIVPLNQAQAAAQ